MKVKSLEAVAAAASEIEMMQKSTPELDSMSGTKATVNNIPEQRETVLNPSSKWAHENPMVREKNLETNWQRFLDASSNRYYLYNATTKQSKWA